MSSVSVPLIIGTAGGSSVQSSPHRLWNMYPIASSLSKQGVIWRNTPGWSEWLDLTTGDIRASIVFKGNLYVVHDTVVKKITPAKTVTTVITGIHASNPVDMAEDGFSLIVSDGVALHLWDDTVASTPTLPDALSAPASVIFHDGFFIARQGDSGQFFISDGFDGATWDDLQFATAEDKPDNITSLASDRLLWLFGEYTTQAYYNDGDTFPFKANPQGNIIYGMAGLRTHAQLDNTLYWLAQSKHGGYKVVRANGYTPEAVSTPEIEEEINSFSDISDAYAITIMWQGHEWYVLTFPTENRTFVYTTLQQWFEWGNYDAGTDILEAHPATSHVYFERQNLFTQADGKIMILEADTYDHDGATMMSMGISNVQHVDEQRIYLRSLIYDIRTGMTPADVNIQTAISYDAGNTYSDWIDRSLGSAGDYNHRIQIHRLGTGFNVVLKWRISGAVKREIIRAVLDVDVNETYLERRNERAGLDTE